MKKKRTQKKIWNPLCHSIEIPYASIRREECKKEKRKNSNTERGMGFEFLGGGEVLVDE